MQEKSQEIINDKLKIKNIKKTYRKKRVLIPSIIMITLLLFGIFSFFNSLKYQSTDDAFVEGTQISIAPKISGQVIALHFSDNEFVKKGQLLIEIDPRDYQNKVDELEAAVQEAGANTQVSISDIDKSGANLAQANKNLEFAKTDYDRYKKLKAKGLCTKQQFDKAETDYKQALDNEKALTAVLKSSTAKKDATSANYDKLVAQLAQAKLNLSYTKIYAPQDGNISTRNVEIGNYVQVGQGLITIVSPSIWIVANYKETQVTHMRAGEEVSIKIDTYPRKRFKGKVDSLQKLSGAKASLFPPENAVGSYVKVVQRIPVKIVFDEDISKYNIAPGMSVVPKVKIR